MDEDKEQPVVQAQLVLSCSVCGTLIVPPPEKQFLCPGCNTLLQAPPSPSLEPAAGQIPPTPLSLRTSHGRTITVSGAPASAGRSDASATSSSSPSTARTLTDMDSIPAPGFVLSSPAPSSPLKLGQPQQQRAFPPEITQEVETELWQAARKFMRAPADAFAYLGERKIIQPDNPRHIAWFLRNAKGFSKLSVGKFLGEPDDFNTQVLQAYTETFDFTGMKFINALRYFLSEFRLAPESEKVQRVVEAFSKRYYANNPTSFKEEDTVYKLALVTMVLNTNYHNPNARRFCEPMKEASFIKSVQEMTEGSEELPSEMLSAIYRDVVANEFKIKNDDLHHGDSLMFLGADKEGWLKKKGHHGTQKRWFLLHDRCLYYFNTPEDVRKENPRLILPLDGVVVEKNDGFKKGRSFVLRSAMKGLSLKGCKREENGVLTPINTKEIVLWAKTTEERDEWVSVLQKAISTQGSAAADMLSTIEKLKRSVSKGKLSRTSTLTTPKPVASPANASASATTAQQQQSQPVAAPMVSKGAVETAPETPKKASSIPSIDIVPTPPQGVAVPASVDSLAAGVANVPVAETAVQWH